MSGHDVERIAQYHCQCGENPLWDEQRGVLYWTDIPTRRLFRFDARSGEHEPIHAGDQQVGGFTLQEDGSLLLFRERDIAVLHADGCASPRIAFADDGVPRFNDVMADAAGRVFAGTMGQDKRGGLYRIDHDGAITNLWRGTNCSNGMAFTGDLRTMYWTDTTARTVDAFDYDAQTSELGNRRNVITVPDDQGAPDGITIDTAGRLYSARWGGAAVCIHSRTGELIDTIALPVPNVTSCCFGGDDLHDLYITTAGGDKDKPGDDGGLFRVTLKAQGRVEFRSGIVI